jgi:hypothetical protein
MARRAVEDRPYGIATWFMGIRRQLYKLIHDLNRIRAEGEEKLSVKGRE